MVTDMNVIHMYVKHFPEHDKPWMGVFVKIDNKTKTGEVIYVAEASTPEDLEQIFNLFVAEPTIPQ